MAVFGRDDEELKKQKTKENYMNPEELKAGFAAFKTAQEQAHASVVALVKEQEKGSKEGIQNAIAVAEKAAASVQAQADRLVALEQKLVKNIMDGKEAPKSFGHLVVEDQSFKAFQSGQAGKCRIVLKNGFNVQANTIVGQSGSPAANNDTLSPAERRGIVGGAFQQLRAKDLIPQGNTNANAVEFTRELAFTSNAAGVAEGASKPQSSLTFELYSAPVVTIASWLKVSTQVRDDAPALIAYIENRLRYGIELAEDIQIIRGTGTQDLIGMITSPNLTAFTPTSGDTAIDSASRAFRALDAAGYPATGIIMNPATWGKIERLKSTTSEYLVGSPFGQIVPTLWGKPVVLSSSMTADKLLTAAFNMAFLYLTRQETVVEMFEQDDTNVQKNLITIRAEKRAALGGLRPASVRYGNLTV
jgi:HK97 family phage major capsid protein